MAHQIRYDDADDVDLYTHLGGAAVVIVREEHIQAPSSE